MIISNRTTSNCRCSRFCVGTDAARSHRIPVPSSPSRQTQNAGRSSMRQPLFVRPNGELTAAGLTEVKAASAGEVKNLARDLAATFLHLGQHLLQFGMIKDHERRARVHSRGFF